MCLCVWGGVITIFYTIFEEYDILCENLDQIKSTIRVGTILDKDKILKIKQEKTLMTS